MTVNTTINQTTNINDITIDQFGTLQKYKKVIPALIAKKLDQVLLWNSALKCRGFLQRKSIKKANKW